MALRQPRPDQYEEYIPKEQQAYYQEYQVKSAAKERLKDLLFFVNIALFSVLTVIATYIYLYLQVPVFLAFVLGIVTGFASLRLVQSILRVRYKKAKRMKK